MKKSCPSYLKNYEDIWEQDPHLANLKWFADADYGMFIHYGLYSLLHIKEWAQYFEKIPVSEYGKLADQFTAQNFDAEYITDLAIRCGMKYINFTTCHHDSFCLWDSKVESFNSMNSAAGRDLVRELSEACARKGLGFFAYYTFMMNWRHPYFVSRKEFDSARPDYEEEQPEYLFKKKEDFKLYIDYIERIIDELLTNYKVTGIWFDTIVAWYALGPDYIPIQDIYQRIRTKHPDVLISWKQGATGTEDFASPENTFHDLSERIKSRVGEEGAQRAYTAFQLNKNKHNEVCSSIQKKTWSYNPRCENRTVEELYELYGHAIEHNCNLLLNVGPMADGSISKVHESILLNLKETIDTKGVPNKGRAEDIDTGANAM